jgi:hypothetical protein
LRDATRRAVERCTVVAEQRDDVEVSELVERAKRIVHVLEEGADSVTDARHVGPVVSRDFVGRTREAHDLTRGDLAVELADGERRKQDDSERPLDDSFELGRAEPALPPRSLERSLAVEETEQPPRGVFGHGEFDFDVRRPEERAGRGRFDGEFRRGHEHVVVAGVEAHPDVVVEIGVIARGAGEPTFVRFDGSGGCDVAEIGEWVRGHASASLSPSASFETQPSSGGHSPGAKG